MYNVSFYDRCYRVTTLDACNNFNIYRNGWICYFYYEVLFSLKLANNAPNKIQTNCSADFVTIAVLRQIPAPLSPIIIKITFPPVPIGREKKQYNIKPKSISRGGS